MESNHEFTDLAVTGDLIKAMPESDRWFEIIADPYEEPYPTPSDPSGLKKRKVCIPIKLSTGATGKYYPNATSARKIAVLNMGQTDMRKWVGKKYYWGNLIKQNVAGQMKDILYVTSFYPPTEKV